jgi:hypothetical protein
LKLIIEEKAKAAKKERKKLTEQDIKKTRVSTTDSEARIMKMACNGFRPAFNVQFASTNFGKAIIGVDVVKQGSDSGQTVQMIKQIEKMYGIVPESWLVDGGYKSHEQLDIVEDQYKNCKIYMPVETPRKSEDPYKKKPKDSVAVGKWRERMGTVEAKEVYKERAETAEFVNAQSRNKGLQQFRVRGLDKVKCMALLYAVTHNVYLFINS